MERILVIALARMGDLLQCFPALSDLNRLAGGRGLALLVQKDLEPLARLHPAVRHVIPFDGDTLLGALRGETGWSRIGLDYLDDVWRKVEQLNPQLVVNLTHTAFSGMLCGLIGATEVRGRSYLRGSGPALHGNWTRYFFTLLSSRSCNGVNLVDIHREISGGQRGEMDRMEIPEDARAFADEALRSLAGKVKIALGIGAHHPLRRWPADRWRDAAVLMGRKCDSDIILFGGHDEKPDAAFIEESLADRCLNLCGATDQVQLAAVMDRCDLILGHDSGPLHLAVALRKPCLGLYLAMASAWDTAPYLSGAVSIEPDISCHPCSEKGICPDPKCHRSLESETVADAAQCLLSGENPGRYPGCVVRISTFDPGGWLYLEGDRRAGDELRLVWRQMMRHILNSGTSSQPDDSRSSIHAWTPLWKMKLGQFKEVVLQFVQETLGAIKHLETSSITTFSDRLSLEIPALMARYPEFRPLLDLYRLDCSRDYGSAQQSSIERVLAAQDRLLRRIGVIEQLSYGDPAWSARNCGDLKIQSKERSEAQCLSA